MRMAQDAYGNYVVGVGLTPVSPLPGPISGDGSGGVLSGHGDPDVGLPLQGLAVDPGVTAAKYTNLDTSEEWYWDEAAGTWYQQL
jgi:hypothetical protein